MDRYLSSWLSGGGPGGAHGGDDPNDGTGGRMPEGGWQNLPAIDDANAENSTNKYGNPWGTTGTGTPAATPAANPGQMQFDENARAGNLYMGGFVPLVNYGWANRGNPGLTASAATGAAYGTGQRLLDQGLSTLSGTPEPTGAAPATTAAAATPAPTSPYGGPAGSPGENTGGGTSTNGNEAALRRYLYGA